MLGKIGRVHDRLSEFGLWLGLSALAAISTLSFAATMSRYFLGSPIGWVPDWLGYLLAFAIFATAPAVTRRSQHVSMDILASYLNSRLAQRILTFTALLATLAILSIMSWVIWTSLASTFAAGTSTAAGYPIPRWWLLAIVFYGFFSSGLHVLRTILAVLGGKSSAEALRNTPSKGH